MKNNVLYCCLFLFLTHLGCASHKSSSTENPEPLLETTGDTEMDSRSGAEPEDTGVEPEDKGAEPEDTGAEPEDTGAEPEDTGAEPEDTGSAPQKTDSESAPDSFDVSETDSNPGQELDWSELEGLINSKVALNNATVMIGDASGTLFSYSRGESTEDTVYAIASASKLLMAITTMRLVEAGDLALDSTPASLLPFWTTDGDDPRSQVTLEQLLSFTSGFSGGSGLAPGDETLPCIEDKNASTTSCAEDIYNEAFEFDPPGSTFYYGPTHMYIAAAMALAVREESTWNQIFRTEVAQPLNLEPLSGFLAPSPLNGRPGGGVLMNGKDYATILTALVAGELLSEESLTQLTTDRTPSSSVTLLDPPTATFGGEWHYALGCWRECPGNYGEENCDAPGVISSPGAFGFYPWWDQEHELWGIVAIQLAVPTGASITTPIGAEIRGKVLEILSNP